MTGNGLHVNEEGKTVWANNIIGALNSQLQTTKDIKNCNKVSTNLYVDAADKWLYDSISYTHIACLSIPVLIIRLQCQKL